MAINSVSQIPIPNPLESDAARIAADIRRKTTPAQRQPIEDYGRCLLHGATPSHGLTARFFTALSICGYRSPSYLRLVGYYARRIEMLRELQQAIAREVARGEVG